jgi:ankyrin repeat protein
LYTHLKSGGGLQFSRIAIAVSALCWLGIASSCHKDDDQINELCAASGRGDTARVQALLKTNPTLVSRKDDNGDTPLHWAAMYGRKDVAALLLAIGADVNANGHRGATPLYYAAWNNQKAVAEELLAQKADVNAGADGRFTPLYVAASRGSKKVAGTAGREQGRRKRKSKRRIYASTRCRIVRSQRYCRIAPCQWS